MSDFKFDKRAIDKMARELVQDEAKDIQKTLDGLLRRYEGRPVPEVKQALKREWTRRGGSISDAEAQDWATHISQGTRIEIRTK